MIKLLWRAYIYSIGPEEEGCILRGRLLNSYVKSNSVSPRAVNTILLQINATHQGDTLAYAVIDPWRLRPPARS
jgi:hypothetical protein